MPANIIGGLISYVQEQLKVNIWDGEVPRQDQFGNDIDPDALPQNWPAITSELPEGGIDREWTFEDFYNEGQGNYISILVFGASGTAIEGRYQVMQTLDLIEKLLANERNWANIILTDTLNNPNYYVISCILKRWTCVQQRGGTGTMRTKTGELIYRGELWYEMVIRGAIQTRDPDTNV